LCAATAGVDGKSAITHIFRHTLTCELIEDAVSALTVKLFGRWAEGSAMKNYEPTSKKTEAMLSASGHDGRDSFFCWWESPGNIPDELLRRVFIGLEECVELAASVKGKYGQNGDDSAYTVCEVLLYLRKVFLEDAAFLRAQHPNFPAYRNHPVFRQQQWEQYAQRELVATDLRQRLWSSKDANLDFQLKDLRKQHLAAAEANTTALAAINGKVEELTKLIMSGAATATMAAAAAAAAAAAGNPSAAAAAVVAAAAAGASGAAAGATPNSSIASSSKEVVPIPAPPESIECMVSYYNQWRDSTKGCYQEHLAKHKRFQWSDLFGLKTGKLMSQRFCNQKDWLDFLDYNADGTERPAAEADAILQLMVAFAGDKIDHSVMVRKVFKSMVKGVAIDGVYRELPGQLRDLLEGSGFVVTQLAKQQQKKRKAAEVDAVVE